MGSIGFLVLNGDFEQGFDVWLQIRQDDNICSSLKGRLSANTELESLLTLKRLHSFNRMSRQRITDNVIQIETITNNYSTCERDPHPNIVNSFMNWLENESDNGWQKIIRRVAFESGRADNFRLVIKTNMSLLHQLPWEKLGFMTCNPKIQIVFRYANDIEPKTPTTNHNTQARILFVLGDSSNIDTDQELKAINQLNNVEVEVLTQPTSRDLIKRLRGDSGESWDIFIFAGHSKTDGENGIIYISETESLKISELKNAFEQAGSKGLKTVFFNSCDGLVIAQQLSPFIPVTIVMREPVPDKVAQSFGTNFITGFAVMNDLYLAYQQARKNLEEFTNDCPGATELPILHHNSNEELPTWQSIKNRVLNERYEVKKHLAIKNGRKTLLARDLKTQNLVVIKLLSFGGNITRNDIERFRREAETLKSLSHPCIPKYLDDIEYGEGYALVQSYINAKSLESYLEAGRNFSEAKVRQIAIAILDVLIYLHKRLPAVIHRDIKPSNILLKLGSDHSVERVYLVGFGFGPIALREDEMMDVVETYRYMPRKQCYNCADSDLYSLGATLIHLITRTHPAKLQTDFWACFPIQFEQAANISPNFAYWLKRMAQPDVSNRFLNANEARQFLLKDEGFYAVKAFLQLLLKDKDFDDNANTSLQFLLKDERFSERFAQVILLLVIIASSLSGLYLVTFTKAFYPIAISIAQPISEGIGRILGVKKVHCESTFNRHPGCKLNDFW